MKYFIFLITNLLLLNVLVNGAFQTSIFRETNNNFLGKNVCISPLSIFQILGLTTNGAKGVTQDEMVSALETTSLENLNNINLNILQSIRQFETVEIANAVMTKFEPTLMFLKICIKYEASILPLVSAEQVNEWCSEKTHGKITKILDELNPDTVMLLINAVYFKADWQHPFNPSFTYTGKFTGPTETKDVRFMTQTKNFNYYEDNNVQVVELPYKNDSTSAIVILPKDKIDVDTYLKSLDDNELNTILAGFTSKRVSLSLPKFEIEFETKLKEILIRLGMAQAFDITADFSGIKCSGGIKVNDVIHKTYLKVDEKGTEAAAVTAVDMIATTALVEIITMNVNRPFIFLLRSTKLPKNNDLLFLTKVANI
jgi:serpin B